MGAERLKLRCGPLSSSWTAARASATPSSLCGHHTQPNVVTSVSHPQKASMNTDRLASHHAASTCPRQLKPVSLASAPPVIKVHHTSARGISVAPRCSSNASSNGNSSVSVDIGRLLPPLPVAKPKTTYLAVGCVPCMDGTLSVQINEDMVVTRFIAETLLPTKHGKFRLRGYKHSVDGGATFTEPTAIIAGSVEGREDVPLRVHDACYTSEVLGSLKCDCAEQLALALRNIDRSPPGMVIYLQQEGRGIGLANKIAAYALQEQGLDTVDANRALGLPDDCREYTSVRNILRDLGIKSVKLITNNPRKIDQLTKLGITISGRLPCIVEAGEFNHGYLETKRSRMDHLLDGQWCYWNHDGEPRASSDARKTLGGMGLPTGVPVVAKS